MRHPNQFERFLLQQLLRAEDGLLSSTLWRRFGIGPAELVKGLRRLEKEEIVSVKGPRIELTDLGRYIVLTQWYIARDDEDRPWRACPSKFRKEALPVGTPIVPKTRELDRDILPERFRTVNKSLDQTTEY
jgi:hypothetical protein